MKQEFDEATSTLRQLNRNHPSNRVKILLARTYLRRARKIEMEYSALNDSPIRWYRRARYEEIAIEARKSPDAKLGISIKLVKPSWPLNAPSSIIIIAVAEDSRGSCSGLKVGQIVAATRITGVDGDNVQQLSGEPLKTFQDIIAQSSDKLKSIYVIQPNDVPETFHLCLKAGR